MATGMECPQCKQKTLSCRYRGDFGGVDYVRNENVSEHPKTHARNSKSFVIWICMQRNAAHAITEQMNMSQEALLYVQIG